MIFPRGRRGALIARIVLMFHPRKSRCIRAVAYIWLAATIGCSGTEQIQSYRVPKEPKATPVADNGPATAGKPTDRLLAAILPAGQQAWFFKAVGPIDAMNRQEKAIKEFFGTLSVGADGRAVWKLPAGWKEQQGASQFVFATLELPGDSQVKFTVSSASATDTPEKMLANVNRWRGQLQLPPIGQAQLPDVAHESRAGSKPITIVDMEGNYQTGGMSGPFAKGAFGPRATGSRSRGSNRPAELPSGHPPIPATSESSAGLPGGLPAGHPAIDSDTSNSPAGSTHESATASEPKFQAPSSWKPMPSNGFRIAPHHITEGTQNADMWFSTFPDAPGSLISDPLANINRWRGEIGLAPITKEALATATEAIQIDGHPAIFAAMIPDVSKAEESKANEATLAALAKNGDQVWFIKMKGDRDLVKKNLADFKAFLQTIQFPHDEAGHGNK